MQTARDLYGERLNVGDEVIPVMSEALIMRIEGVISKIRCDEGQHFLVLSDKEGNLLYDGHCFDSGYFTTQERFDDRERNDNVYSLYFYSNKCSLLTTLPLTNRTDPNYGFPEGTTFVELKSYHMIEVGDVSKSFVSSTEYFFATNAKVKFCYNEEFNSHYLISLETKECKNYITKNNKSFKTDEDLELYIRSIIVFFNNADLKNVNNNVIYSKNLEGKRFEKELLKKIKNSDTCI